MTAKKPRPDWYQRRTVIDPKAPPPKGSWWTKSAAPDQRDQFMVDAHDRELQRVGSPHAAYPMTADAAIGSGKKA